MKKKKEYKKPKQVCRNCKVSTDIIIFGYCKECAIKLGADIK